MGPAAVGPFFSTIELKSTPDGAEIIVDEKFMRNTPSSLRLPAGDHKIRLEKAGFQGWERTMAVGEGATVRVDATVVMNE